jgi:hypothetical protein
MIQTFCDKCGAKVSTKDHGRLRTRLGKIEIETMVCVGGTWNAGHICNTCIREVVAKGKVIPPTYGSGPMLPSQERR